MSRRRDGGRGSGSGSTRPARAARRPAEPHDERTDGPVRRASRRTLRRVVWPLVLTALVAVTLALGVFPTRTYLEKKQEVSLAQQQLDNLTAENDEKQTRVDTLQTDAEIEAIAREEYNLVKPGEETYAVIPPPEEPVQLPDSWPFNLLETDLVAPS